MTNLILGYCSNYKFTKIEAFVTSALKHAKNTCLCLFAADMDEEFYSVARRIGITIIDAKPYRDQRMHILVNRFYMYREFLKQTGNKFDKILLTDVRDVFFQSDPLAPDLRTDVIFSLESTRFIWNETNSKWVSDIYGEHVLKDIEKNYVSCAGTTIGNSSGIKKYVDIMIEQFERKNFPIERNYDQGVHNYIAHYLAPSWSSFDTEDRFVCTLGCVGPELIEIKHDIVLTKSRFSPILHQWDRHANLAEFLVTGSLLRAEHATSERFEKFPADSVNDIKILYSEETSIPTSTSGLRRNEPIPMEIVVGTTLSDLVNKGRATHYMDFSESWEPERVKMFIANDFDLRKSAFGNYFTDLEFRKMRTKQISAFKLSDLVFLGGDSVVLVDNKAVFDTTFDISSWRTESNIEKFESGKYLRLKHERSPNRHLEGEFFIGSNGAWFNYAHWMQQNLPRLVAFCQMRQLITGLRILLPMFPKVSFQAQTLKLLNISETDVEIVDCGEVVSLSSVYLLNRIDLWNVPPFCLSSAKYLLSRIIQTETYNERIYIHRATPPRNVTNFDEIKKCLTKYYFSVVSFESMPVEEQILVMRKARYIIGEHGAGLVNILFCEPGARVLELFNPACVQPAFWSIATTCELQYGYCVGEHVPTEQKPEADWNTDYMIPLKNFETSIISMLDNNPIG